MSHQKEMRILHQNPNSLLKKKKITDISRKSFSVQKCSVLCTKYLELAEGALASVIKLQQSYSAASAALMHFCVRVLG